MATPPGLRARKKEQTRRTIREAAQALFAERGFDAVTVAEVARAADVSEGTVFNYFPTKEDLFYDQMEDFEAALVAAVRGRRPGESVLAAFRRFVLHRAGELVDQARAETIARSTRLVAGSPALLAREREILARSTRVLADALAEETGAAPADVEPRVAASALIGAQRALVAHVHEQVDAGVRGAALVETVQAQGERAFALLDRGLATYAVRDG